MITGATGFIGRAVAEKLLHENYHVFELGRTPSGLETQGFIEIPRLDASVLLEPAIPPVDVIIHTAARVHVMKETDTDPIQAFRKINTEATLALAKQAASAGVKRFIFLSSIKVNGESTPLGKAFNEHVARIPDDPYALSKYEAECGLFDISRATGMEVVVIRPPLVYGPGVKGNFSSMMKWVEKGIPLPLGAVHNKRSFLALGNLVSFIQMCIEHPKATNQTFVLADRDDVSTTQLVRDIAEVMSKKVVLIPIPVKFMCVIATLLGKKLWIARLFGSLQIDCSKAQDLLGWKPEISMKQQLNRMINN